MIITNKRPLKAEGYSSALLIIYRSTNPDAPPEEWTPLTTEEVPQPVKEFDVMGAMVGGMMAFVEDAWYRAEKV